MPLFHFIGLDKPGGLEIRKATRPEHLQYAQPHTRLGGPVLDAGGDPCGSVMIVEAESLEAAKAIMAADPYAKAGLFQSTEIRPWRVAIGAIQGYAG